MPLDDAHDCPWRERALQSERRLNELGEVVARQQTLLEQQRELIEQQAARSAEQATQQAAQEARVAELSHEVETLRRSLVGRSTEKTKVPSHARESAKELSEQDEAKRRAEAERKRRERAAERERNMPTETVEHALAEEQKACETCGGACNFVELPPEETNRIEYVPGRFIRRRHRRQKSIRKCACQETQIVVAPGPPAALAGSLYGGSFVAFLIVAKCADAIPIHRLETRFERIGILISRSTMNELVLAAAERLRPLHERLIERMSAVEIVLADETSMRLQDREKRGFVWVFHGQDDTSGGQLVLYMFSCDRSGETPNEVLGASTGALLVDGYTGYNHVTDPSHRERAGCWCHARRKFFEAKTSALELATHGIDLIRPLLRVEHEATMKRIVGTAEHLDMRRERSRPQLAEIFKWADDHRPTVLPKSPIGAALRYLDNQRKRLELFVHDPRIPLHNNSSESRLRIIALVRKNSLFFGHPRAGHLFAGLFSLVGGAVANGHEPTAYLIDVLERIHDATGDPDALDALLPDRWAPATAAARAQLPVDIKAFE